MKVVAVQSLSPGAGATTLVANLAGALQRDGRNVVVIDADPRDQLKLHFGMSLVDQDGWWPSTTGQLELAESAFIARPELDAARVSAHFIPFGRRSSTPEADNAYDVLLRHPKAFQEALKELPLDTSTIVLINITDALSLLHYQVMSLADEVITLLEPGPLWQAQLLRGYADFMSERLASGGSLSVLLTKCRPELQLNNDCAQLLEAELSTSVLVPLTIKQDQHVPEALAQQQLVEDTNANSSYVNEIDALAMWLASRLERS